MKASLRVSALLILMLGCGRSNMITGDPGSQYTAGQPLSQGALVRRKGAEQIVRNLEVQLGLTDMDIFSGSYTTGAAELYPARSPDAAPLISTPAQNNYIALGGPYWLKSRKASTEPSAVFAQQLVPMSQAWCRLALQKAGSPILVDASLSDSSSSPNGKDRIRRNIAGLHLRMLGEPASDADVNDLLDLFQVYEPNGSEAAWTAVCAALIRHPLWITF